MSMGMGMARMGGVCNESGGTSGNVRELTREDDGVRSHGPPNEGVDVELERGEDVSGGGGEGDDSETSGSVKGRVYVLSWLMGHNKRKGMTTSATSSLYQPQTQRYNVPLSASTSFLSISTIVIPNELPCSVRQTRCTHS